MYSKCDETDIINFVIITTIYCNYQYILIQNNVTATLMLLIVTICTWWNYIQTNVIITLMIVIVTKCTKW